MKINVKGISKIENEKYRESLTVFVVTKALKKASKKMQGGKSFLKRKSLKMDN